MTIEPNYIAYPGEGSGNRLVRSTKNGARVHSLSKNWLRGRVSQTPIVLGACKQAENHTETLEPSCYPERFVYTNSTPTHTNNGERVPKPPEAKSTILQAILNDGEHTRLIGP